MWVRLHTIQLYGFTIFAYTIPFLALNEILSASEFRYALTLSQSFLVVRLAAIDIYTGRRESNRILVGMWYIADDTSLTTKSYMR